MNIFKKWKFVNCSTPSESRKKLSKFIESGVGSQYRLVVVGVSYGFEWR